MNSETKISSKEQMKIKGAMEKRNTSIFDNFTRKYSLSKTLRFELKPVGETEKHIQLSDEKNILKKLLDDDKKRANEYEIIKTLIDEYHKEFINETLPNCKIDLSSLERHEKLFLKSYRSSSDEEKKEFKEIKKKLREKIAKVFSDNKKFSLLDKESLIKEKTDTETGEITGNIIPKWYERNKESVLKNLKKQYVQKIDDEKIKEVIERFSRFFTYLKPFCENRKKNIYTYEAISTSIANRCIEINLPKFLNNKNEYKKIKNSLGKRLETIERELKINSIDSCFELANFNNSLTQSGIDQYNKTISGVKVSGKLQFKGLNQHIKEYNDQQSDKNKKLPKLKKLYNQILGDRDSGSFRYEPFESDKKAVEEVKQFYKKTLLENSEIDENKTLNILKDIKELLSYLKNYKLDKIHVKAGNSLTLMSTKIFNNPKIENAWSIINHALIEYYNEEKNQDSPKSVLKNAEKEIFEITGKRKNSKNKNARNELKKQIDKLKRKKEKYEAYVSDMEKWLNDQEYFSIANLEAALNEYNEKTNDEIIKGKITANTICDYFAGFGNEKKSEKEKETNLLERIEDAYKASSDVFSKEMNDQTLLTRPILKDDEEEDENDKSETARIKRLLDCIKALLHFIKPLHTADVPIDPYPAFYNTFNDFHDQLSGIVPLYNKTRNRLTKKPYILDKIRLNFDKGTLLGGWVESNGSTQYSGYLFRKINSSYWNFSGKTEYDYFLGISKDTQLFSCDWSMKDENNKNNDEYQRLNYYQLNPQTENSSLKKFLIEFAASNKVLSKKIENHFKEKINNANTCLKTFSNELQNHFEILVDKNQFNLKDYEIVKDNPKEKLYADKIYTTFRELFNDIRKKEFRYYSLNKNEFDNALLGKKEKKGVVSKSHPLHLFKITNKDLSYAETYAAEKRNKKNKPRGVENLHTIYFRQLMNGEQNVIDIGTGMVFWRDASDAIKKAPTHKAKVKIKSKNPLRQKESEFEYDLIKDKRFTEGKYFLHLSTVINYQQDAPPKQKYIYGWNEELNLKVIKWLESEKEEIKIIGIDRGERHLLYVSVINQNGKIEKQFSLNEISSMFKTKNGEELFSTPYHTLLKWKGDKRTKARKSWGIIENIKELKEGYLSQVIYEISKKVVQDGNVKAIIALEALNPGFKRGRQKVEHSLYQKFEKMLINKLNYLVFKDKQPEEKGGALNGWQLTGIYDTKSLEGLKQSGIVFYVPAAYTSTIDYATGFVNFFHHLPYGNISKSQKFFKDFERIEFRNNMFEFEFDYSKFPDNAKKAVGQMKWTIFTTPEKRYRWNKFKSGTDGHGGYDEYDVTTELKILLSENGIANFKNLQRDIIKQNSVDFFNMLLKLFSVTLQLRHNNGLKEDKEEDHIVSPVIKNGKNFKTLKENKIEPDNADANGAYHIAKKGWLILKRIKGDKEVKKINKKGSIDLSISNKEWLEFMQSGR